MAPPAPQRPPAGPPAIQIFAYRDAGLSYLRMDDAGIVERLLANPALLRLPLVRHGNEVTVGRAETTWSARLRPVDRL